MHGVDDRGEPERIVIWIERTPRSALGSGTGGEPAAPAERGAAARGLRLPGRRARRTRSRPRTARSGPLQGLGPGRAQAEAKPFSGTTRSSRSSAGSSGARRRQLPGFGHSRSAFGMGSPCGSCVGKPSALSIRASSSSERTSRAGRPRRGRSRRVARASWRGRARAAGGAGSPRRPPSRRPGSGGRRDREQYARTKQHRTTRALEMFHIAVEVRASEERKGAVGDVERL